MIRIPTIPFCPVTGNQPLTCTEKGFTESCRAFRGLFARKAVRRFEYCAICQGEVPKNVTFIKLSQQQQEEAMGYVKKIDGICEQCGVKKGLISHFGKKVCPTCSIVRTSVKNKPEIAIAVLREFNAMPEQAGQNEAHASDAHLLAENHQLRGDIAKLRTELDEYVAMVNEFKSRRQRSDYLAEKLEQERAARLVTVKENLAMKVEIDRLTALATISAAAEANNSNQSDIAGHMAIKLRDLAWKLADGVMTGEIHGVTVDDIRILRQAA